MDQSKNPNDEAIERVVIDEDKPLSECSVWEMLEQLYSTQNARGLWEAVPSFVTSNAFIGAAYADLIVAFLQDYLPYLYADEPIYIIELGSGSGSFSFYTLNELYRKLGYFSELSELAVKYVMADFTPETLADCREHENFAQFRNSGKLSFALFKPEEQSEIITYGGTRLASDTIRNPVIVIANYIFDSLRQDAFRVYNGQLQEVRHTFTRKLDGREPSFDQLEKSESYFDIDGDYYDDEDLDAILQFYKQRFENASIVFPIGAFRSLRNLQRMSNNNLVLISTDRGFTREGFVEGIWPQQFLSERIFFSYPVNFFAIRKYFEQYDGTSFATVGDCNVVHTQFSCMLEESDCALEQTRYCFTEMMERRNVINSLYNWLEVFVERKNPTPNEIVMAYSGLIRMCNYDTIAFCDCAEKICDNVNNIYTNVASDLSAMLNVVEENFFHVRQMHDSLYWIGRLRYALGQYDGAISALLKSLQEFGDNPNSLFYLACCYEMQGYYDTSLENFERSLKLAPESELAAQAISRLKEKGASSKSD